jgi:hypothetical protein
MTQAHRIKITAKILLLLLATLGLANVQGATVRAASLTEMLSNCELVFEGRAVQREVREDPSTQSVRTYITFEVLDVISGNFDNPTLELSFLGGTLGRRRLVIADMALPELETKGIYFVESLSRLQIHPLFGWSQGHILVVKDQQGVERVSTADGHAVTGFQFQEGGSISGFFLSTGAARELLLATDGSLAQALSLEEFKHQLRERLKAN